MDKEITIDNIKKKFENIYPYMNEKTIRLWCATEAKSYGYGGIAIVAKATNMSRTTIKKGIMELESKSKIIANQKKIRAVGGGRKNLLSQYPGIAKNINNLMVNNNQNILLWTEKSVQQITNTLNYKKYSISSRTVNRLLKNMGYIVQRKQQYFKEQFLHIDKKIAYALKKDIPVLYISIKENASHEICDSIKIKGNTQRLFVNIYSVDMQIKLIIKSLYVWANRFSKELKKETEIFLFVDISEIPKSSFWEKSLQNFANNQKILIHVHYVLNGIKKWSIQKRFSILYPEEKQNIKSQNRRGIVYYIWKKVKNSKETAIYNSMAINVDISKVNIVFDALIPWCYTICPL